MYSIHDLTERYRISRHTVYKYISQGVIPPPNGMGCTASYDKRHTELLDLIWGRNGLKDSNMTLAEFAERHNPQEDFDC